VSRIISQSESYEAEQPLSKMMSETETYGPEEVPLASAKQLASK
jgi:hypothetical protein